MKLFSIFRRKKRIDVSRGIVVVSLDALFREYEREILLGKTEEPFIRWLNGKIKNYYGVRFDTGQIMQEVTA